MKVLMYGWEYPPNISGGLGVACHGIVHGLLEHNVNVTLVLPESKNFNLHHNNTSNFQILKSEYHNTVIDAYTPNYNDDIKNAIDHYTNIAGEYATNIPHDIIHTHDWLTILSGVAAKRVSQKPLVFHVHSLEVERSGFFTNQSIYNIEKYGLEQADHIIAVSQFTKDNIVRYYNIPHEKIFVVHNGIFKDQIYTQKEQSISLSKIKTVLFLGRVTHQKSPFHFIEAAKKILDTRNDVQFVIAGDGDLFQSVVERVAELKLGTHVHFTKFLPKEQVEQLYEKSDVYVMPSVSEPFGLTCLEAIAQRVPVVLSKQSGVSEVIQNVLKVDFWDIEEMASCISALLDYPALRQQLVENALPELHQLLWHQTGQKIANLYQNIMRV